MKLFLIILLSVFCFTTFVQAQPSAPLVGYKKPPPMYFIDGVPLNNSFKNSFTEDQIKHQRLTEDRYRDTIYLTLKDHRQLHTLLDKKKVSLQQLASHNIAEFSKSSAVVFFKNDSLLLDTIGLRIPELLVFKTRVLRAVKTSYYEGLPDATFFYIYTRP